ncbi:MAG: protein-glutamate methylesterase/protein-glutamine glutaminase [Alphaproteobacteria bacterium]
MNSAFAQPKPAGQKIPSSLYRVMVVDDSAVIRGQLVRALDSDPAIDVVASVANGELAVKKISETEVDVVVLDIEMPVMDGLTALPLLLKAKPRTKIIMASTLTLLNARVSLEALAKGASDYIAKPTTTGALITAADFKRDLVEKVKALAKGKGIAGRLAATQKAKPSLYKKAITLRAPGKTRPEALAVGSSTGGPQALLKLFGALKTSVKVPIFIAQHMPATFTTILAEHLGRASGMTAAEGVDGEVVVGGRIYLAPGDFHMSVEKIGMKRVIRLSKGEKENFCRPSVDPMLRGVVSSYGANVLTVILTGMGHDGRDGCKAVVEAGGTVVAQDEASSVVWGMPGAVATGGLCSVVLPVDAIASHVGKFLQGNVR